MKRRGAAALTGLGGNAKVYMSGQPTKDEKFNKVINAAAKDAYETFFKKFGYCDAGVDGEEVRLGIEPTYQFEPLKIVAINKDKDQSRFITGRAVGPWASAVQSTIKEYRDYQRHSKFIRFVDKWHPLLFALPASNSSQ